MRQKKLANSRYRKGEKMDKLQNVDDAIRKEYLEELKKVMAG